MGSEAKCRAVSARRHGTGDAMRRAFLSLLCLVCLVCAATTTLASCRSGDGASTSSATRTVNPAWSSPAAPFSRLVLGHNTVWSRGGLGLWDDAAHAPSAPVLALVRDLHPGILRFPGGTRAMRYHFAEAIGPLGARVPQCDSFLGTADATSYGLDEFLSVASAVSAEVTLVAPWVDGSPQETAALVAYVNGDASSSVHIGMDANATDWGTAGEWAQRRGANGHPAPYGVRFIEIGNEQYLDLAVGPLTSCGRPSQFKQDERWVSGNAIPTTAADYAAQVVATARLVRAIDPTIRIGASAYSSFDGVSDASKESGDVDHKLGSADGWNARLVTSAADAFDFFILHPYDLTASDNRLRLAERLRKSVRDLRALAPGKGIAVTEFGFLGGGDTLMNAIVTADVARVAIEENLVMSLRHILVEDDASGLFANAAAILGPDHARTPAYEVMQAMATTLSGHHVPTKEPAPDIEALVTRDAAGAIALVILDRRTDATDATSLDVALPASSFHATVTAIHGPALGSKAAEVTVDRAETSASGVLHVTMPANGVLVARLVVSP